MNGDKLKSTPEQGKEAVKIPEVSYQDFCMSPLLSFSTQCRFSDFQKLF